MKYLKRGTTFSGLVKPKFKKKDRLVHFILGANECEGFIIVFASEYELLIGQVIQIDILPWLDIYNEEVGIDNLLIATKEQIIEILTKYKITNIVFDEKT